MSLLSLIWNRPSKLVNHCQIKHLAIHCVTVIAGGNYFRSLKEKSGQIEARVKESGSMQSLEEIGSEIARKPGPRRVATFSLKPVSDRSTQAPREDLIL